MREEDKHFMAMCLRLAEKGRGYVSPNPLVGAVLVRGGKVVARGYHQRFGGPHAEVECLCSYKGVMRNATLYVNLEPCTHYGKTPPCTELIIKSGVRNVVVGMKDPNPLVSGKGIRRLRNAGIRVVTGVLEGESRFLNRHFVTYITKRRPFVHLKIAQTLDGKIGRKRGSPSLVSCLESRKLVHKWRAEHDAVLVGAGTIMSDDPRLNVRLANGRNPALALLDGSLSLNPSYKVFKNAGERRCFLVVSRHAFEKRRDKVKEFASAGVILVPLPSENKTVALKRVLKKLCELGIGSVLVEGGQRVFTEFVESGMADLVSVFVAPTVFSGGIQALSENMKSAQAKHHLIGQLESVRQVGTDALLQFIPLKR